MRSGDEPAPSATLGETVSWEATDLPGYCSTLEVPVVDPRHYEVVRELARGGVGRILEAVDTRLRREVALKQLIRPGENRARFIREAMLTARLQHPAIVAVHEVGVLAGGGGPFIAMKLVRGESLKAAIVRRASLAERLELIPAVLAVADAMAYAHSQRVIHRDLKPANVLLGSFGEVVVVDWGLAKHLDVTEPAVDVDPATATAAGVDATQAGAIFGTPAYMPPEQALGRSVDERADVYALGAVLYEVLSGEVPISGATAHEIIRKLITSAPTPIEQRVPSLPSDLAAIVTKAMRTDPVERYRDAAALAADLRRFQLGQVISVPREELEHDPAIEVAFREETRRLTMSALRMTCIIGLILVAGFGFVAYAHFGKFGRSDTVPRSITLLTLAFILGATWWPRSRAWDQALSMLTVFAVGAMVIAMGVLQQDAVGWFTSSMVLVFLGCTLLLRLTGRSVLLVLSLLTVCGALAMLTVGVGPTTPKFIVQNSMLVASTAIAFIGANTNHRVRRAEFYNRHRLQRANERLAQLDRGRP